MIFCEVLHGLQDVGVVRLIRRVAPSLPIHGSTQMSITSSEVSLPSQQGQLYAYDVLAEISISPQL